jgi:hypothetical protein
MLTDIVCLALVLGMFASAFGMIALCDRVRGRS